MRVAAWMLLILIAVLAMLSAGKAGADQVTLTPSLDNTLYEPIPPDFSDASNGAGSYVFTGRTNTGYRRRAVLRFNVAGNIPSGSTITAVQLILNCSRVSDNTARNTTIHRLLSNWGEGASNADQQEGKGATPAPGDATYHHTFYPSSFWLNTGGDWSATASATTSVAGLGSYTWGSTAGMVSDVQQWLDSSATNFGWVVIGTESVVETSKRFDSRENTGGGGQDKPKLLISYTPLQLVGACCLSEACSIVTESACTVAGGLFHGVGTSCSPSPCTVPTGACCASNGTCSEVTESSCTGSSGIFQGDGSTCLTVECPISLNPYMDALPVPAVATPIIGQPGEAATYNMAMKEFSQQLHSQLPPTTVWGFDDGFAGPKFPGPTIVARANLPVTVNWMNDIRELGTGNLRSSHYLEVETGCIHGAENSARTVIHLHGGHVEEASDGHPESTFLPGAMDTYEYPNNQQASWLWYHDHALGITRLNVYMGLAGAYLVRDSVEDALNLPAGEYEIPLVIQDRRFNPDGTLEYPAEWMDHFFGDKILVNGKVWPYLQVKKGKYRFRILNGSGSRVYTLSLLPPSGSLPLTVIGTEGGLLEAPVSGLSSLTIGPGERYDVVVDFSSFANGNEILLQNSAPAPFPNGAIDEMKVLKFVVTNTPGYTTALPAALRSIEHLNPEDAVNTRDFILKRTGTDSCGRSYWQINSLGWMDIVEYPRLDTIEVWQFINDSGVSHPMHMHLVMFQILNREPFTVGAGGEIVPSGSPALPAAHENGWKDTVMVGPNEIVRVVARFEDYKGRYAYHCHILEHEDHEMMRQFQTIRCGDGILDPTEECDNGTPGFFGCSATCEQTCGLFCDDFETGGLATDWTYIKTAWTETGGNLIGIPAGRKTTAIASPAFSGCLNCSISAAVQTAGGIGNKVWLLGWFVDKKTSVELIMSEERDKWILKQKSNGMVVAKGKGLGTILPNVNYDVKIAFDGAKFRVTVNDALILEMNAAAGLKSGTVGFQVKSTTATIGEISVD